MNINQTEIINNVDDEFLNLNDGYIRIGPGPIQGTTLVIFESPEATPDSLRMRKEKAAFDDFLAAEGAVPQSDIANEQVVWIIPANSAKLILVRHEVNPLFSNSTEEIARLNALPKAARFRGTSQENSSFDRFTVLCPGNFDLHAFTDSISSGQTNSKILTDSSKNTTA